MRRFHPSSSCDHRRQRHPRQSTSHGMKALTDFPEQRAWLMEDLDGRMPLAVEEIVRWATPIMTFRRTAARHRTGRSAHH